MKKKTTKAISTPAVSCESQFSEFSCFLVLTCHGRGLRELAVFGVFGRGFLTKIAVDLFRLLEKVCRFYASRAKRSRTRGELAANLRRR